MSENKKCKSCKEFKKCVNFAGYHAKENDNIFPYYVPKKRKEKELFVCRDQSEELEVELTDIENSKVAKEFMGVVRKESENAEN